MFKATIIYTDYNGTERQEEHFFNLNRAEAIKWQNSVDGGLDNKINEMLDNSDPKIFDIFEQLIEISYGKKTSDGKYFEKEDVNGRPYYKEFKRSAAYEKFMMDLMDADKAAAFFNGVVPRLTDKERAAVDKIENEFKGRE